MGEDVIEQLSAGCILEDNPIVSLRFFHPMEPNNIRVGELLEDRYFAHDLGHPRRVVTQLILLDKLDGDLRERRIESQHCNHEQLYAWGRRRT